AAVTWDRGSGLVAAKHRTGAFAVAAACKALEMLLMRAAAREAAAA
ncbi:tRNA threonylcarbamoyladenosine dehydratase, partial [Xanthomonas sp. LMG 8993]|nr:tRNA threonylcarbamoyladenosine dehydratase [Xanthomonas sp. LMG 8993]